MQALPALMTVELKKNLQSAVTLLLGEAYFDEQKTQRDEFTHYLEELPLNPNGNPFKWWMVNEQRFPKFSCISRKHLCAPSTSVPSERVFSAAGNIISKTHSSLLPENVNSLIFLNKNLVLNCNFQARILNMK